MRTIKVVPYDSNWPKLFEEEAALLQIALGDNCIAILHIGSTSIPGLEAKPIIDILPVVKDILAVDMISEAMISLGYDVRGEQGMAFRRFFHKRSPSRSCNVHVYEENNPEINRYLKFRDWMRSHKDDALAYGNLKQDLAQKYPDDIFQYCSGKDAFVASIDAKTGFNGWRMVQALTKSEWSAVDSLKKMASDFSPINKEKEHIHFVFYKNEKVIGYAHLEPCPENTAILQTLVIEDKHRNQGFGKKFLELCERWLTHQNYKKLRITSPQGMFEFYKNLGYAKISSDEHYLQKFELEKTF